MFDEKTRISGTLNKTGIKTNDLTNRGAYNSAKTKKGDRNSRKGADILKNSLTSLSPTKIQLKHTKSTVSHETKKTQQNLPLFS
jgi:hypothetical protein